MSEKLTRALAAAMAHSPEPMALSDPSLPDNPIVAVNQAFADLTGYTEAETCGRNCRFLQGERTDAKTPPRIRSALALQRGCIEWIVNYRRDGSVFWNLLFLSPVFARDGSLLHYFANQRNITAGPPADLPDYILGKADMPPAGRQIFDDLLLDMLEAPASAAESGAALTQLVERARQLNEVTLRLVPTPWSMPPA
jgi:PAS domain S-box-containing protein